MKENTNIKLVQSVEGSSAVSFGMPDGLPPYFDVDGRADGGDGNGKKGKGLQGTRQGCFLTNG